MAEDQGKAWIQHAWEEKAFHVLVAVELSPKIAVSSEVVGATAVHKAQEEAMHRSGDHKDVSFGMHRFLSLSLSLSLARSFSPCLSLSHIIYIYIYVCIYIYIYICLFIFYLLFIYIYLIAFKELCISA